MDSSIDAVKQYLKTNLSKKRYIHSLNVADECEKFAQCYGENAQKAYFAGLVHDICKEMPHQQQRDLIENCSFDVENVELVSKQLWHAVAGAVFIREQLGVEDADILNAVRFHTIGHAGMSKLEEIVYLGDLISADRNFKDLGKMRKLAYTNPDEAMLEALVFTILNIVKKYGNIPIYTIEAYNQYVYVCMNKENNR